MADMTTLNLRNENEDDSFTTSELVAAAGTLTIDMAGHKRAIVEVKNADAAADAYVTIKKGDGPTSALGDRIVKVAYGDEAAIKITDTSRHLASSTGKITVALNDSAGAALAAGVLSDITIKAFVE